MWLVIVELYYEDYWGRPVLFETIEIDDGQPGITYHDGPLPDAIRQMMLAQSERSPILDTLPDLGEDEDLFLLEAGDRQPLPTTLIHVRLRRAWQRFPEVFRKWFA